ncbi:MAG: 30S ribosomal protein S19e [Methanobacteriota archaeon]
MTTTYDIPAKDLIDALHKKLQNEKAVAPPEWSKYVRTGVHTEKSPVDKNWWYTRCASVLRKIYISNGIGVQRLREEYGGYRDRGSKPNRARAGSGAIIRTMVQQLEEAGYVMTIRGKGRVLTGKGRSFLDNTAHEVMQGLLTVHPELKKY